MVHGYGVDSKTNDYLVFSSFLNGVYYWLTQSHGVESIRSFDMKNDEFWNIRSIPSRGLGIMMSNLWILMLLLSREVWWGVGGGSGRWLWEGDVIVNGNGKRKRK